MDSNTSVKVALALVPFITLFGGLLVFHWGSLKTVVVTCVVEFVIAVLFYKASPLHSVEAALWGNVAVWPTLLITFVAQIFGYCYKRTGLMRVMLDSISGLLPAGERDGRAFALLAPVSGVFSNFEARAAYPVVVPGLVELGYDPVKASAAALVFMTWVMPLQGLMIGAIIANLATHIPIPKIAVAVGQYSIPEVFLCILTLRSWGTKSLDALFSDHVLDDCVALCRVNSTVHPGLAGVLCAEPDGGRGPEHRLPLCFGAVRRRQVGEGGGSMTAPAPRSLSSAAVTPASDGSPASGGSPKWSVVLRGWGPLLLGFVYAAFMISPVGKSVLSHFSFKIAAWGFKPVAVNVLDTPSMPVLIGALSAYLFRTQPSNLVKDFATGLYRGVSPMLTFMFGVGIMYLLVYTKQIDFLGQLMSTGGETLFKLLDSTMVVAGGTIFGSGTPPSSPSPRCRCRPCTPSSCR